MNFASSLQGHYRPRIFVLSLLGLIATSPAFAQSPPKYSAKVPPSIQTPDTVQTRIGTLKFSDGLPDADTVTKVYDQLDFARGVEAFLTGMPAASVYALCEGFGQAASSLSNFRAILRRSPASSTYRSS